MPVQKIYQRRGKKDQSHNYWLQKTKSTPSRPNSHICDESSVIFALLGEKDEIGTEEANLADPIQDHKSATISVLPGPLPQCDDLNAKSIEPSPSFDITMPARSTPLRSNSHICDESLIVLAPLGGNNETGIEGASLADPIHDQKSATMSIMPGPLSQCDDLNAKFTEPSLSFDIPNLAKSLLLRPWSHICDESSVMLAPLGGNNEIGTEGASLADPMHDQELETISIVPNPSPQCDELNAKPTEPSRSFGIPTPAKFAPLRPCSHMFEEFSVILAPLGGNNEIGIEGASLADPIHDQESATISIERGPLSQCKDLNSKPIEASPSFGILTPASKDRKRKNNEQDYDRRPQKRPKKKVYWPKVMGQTKRRKAPKVSNESKTKKRPVFVVDGKGKPKRTPKLKTAKKVEQSAPKVDEGKFDMPCCELRPSSDKHEVKVKLPSTPEEQITLGERTLLHSKTKSSKRSLKFELEENIEESPHTPNWLDELGCKGNSLQLSRNRIRRKGIPQENIPQEKIFRRCSLLVKIRKIKPNFPKACKKKRIQKLKSLFQSIRKGKRSNNRRRRSNLNVVPLCNQTSLSKYGVEEKREEKHGVEEKREEKHGVEEKREEKHGVEEKREEKHGVEENREVVVHGVEEKREEEYGVKKKIIRKKRTLVEEKIKMISDRTMGSLIKKFQSLVINDRHNDLVLHKNQDSKLVPHRGIKEGKQRKVKVNHDERTIRMWNFLMEGKAYQENEEDKKYWEQERKIYLGRVNAFNARMHLILGDRRFSPWKGSVLDSVIGVFLTQNVSDHLSSSAYMSLAATFPIKTSSSEERKKDLFVRDKNVDGVEVHNSSKVNKRIENILNTKKKKPDSPGMVFGKKKSVVTSKKVNQVDQEKKTKENKEAEEQEKQYWESLRKTYVQHCTQHSNHMSLVDWEAVRCAEVEKVAKAIEGRGQHNVMAQRIQAFLNKLVEMHGSIDLEWLRYAPPNEVKKYLLNVYGLGLKSVECIRLLALQHNAFPVDVNVGRIAVRLGWVPLEPLPEQLQIHLLDQYPIIDVVQQYLWPRLCTLDQPTLYELHYQLITFGKVFCTKLQPNCNVCPMRGECLHFASAFASVKLALPGPADNSIVISDAAAKSFKNSTHSISISELNNLSTSEAKNCEPIIEMPASPSPEYTEFEENDIEDFYKNDDSEEIMTINLNAEERMKTTYNYFDQDDMNMSKALVALSVDTTSIPMRKLRSVSRLRTERMVYVLPDTHPLLVGFKMREVDDPSPYLLVIWTPGELKSSCESSKNNCDVSTDHCSSCNNAEEENNQTVPGTLLIPSRTAMDGRFPLNGTYFQVNEVFADADSSQNPINVPRNWIWNLQIQTAYFGTSTSTILKGALLAEIHNCFWRGFVCVRGFDRKTGAPRPLSNRFHLNTTNKQMKKNQKADT